MCSLKTEQRKVQKRVRASAPVASASGVGVHSNFRIILKDNKSSSLMPDRGRPPGPILALNNMIEE
jgi:hypothetical protein